MCNKLRKEAKELVLQYYDENGDIVNRCEIVESMLEKKRKLLGKIDKEILALCDVTEIAADIEDRWKLTLEY